MSPLQRLTAIAAGALAVATSFTPLAHARTAVPGPHVDSIEHARQWAAAGTSFTAAASTPGVWCGALGSADDTAHEVAQSGPMFHVVIAYPSDSAADLHRLADDAFARVKVLEAFWAQRVGVSGVGTGSALGWKIRFDYGTAGCGAGTDGSAFPDISFYRLPHPASYYPSGSSTPYSQIASDLTASGLYGAANKRYLVHFVGSGGPACGQSYIYAPSDNGGGNRYSIIYDFNYEGVSTCTWETDAHEMGHSIGAATGGPQNNDGAHTWDCYNDVMSYASITVQCGDRVLYFDYGHDNYFQHGGAWNDTRSSGYWCKPGC